MIVKKFYYLCQPYRIIRKVCLIITLLGCPLLMHGQQQFTIANNLLYDATLTPNLSLGLSLNERWSAALSMGLRPWPSDDERTRKYRHLQVAPQVRWWTDSVFQRSYVGMQLVYSHYNVGGITIPLYSGVKDHRRQGDLVAVGASYGYNWSLGSHFHLEAEAGLSVGYAWYKEYECPHCGDYLGDGHKVFLMPKLALNIVYNIETGKTTKSK